MQQKARRACTTSFLNIKRRAAAKKFASMPKNEHSRQHKIVSNELYSFINKPNSGF